MCAGRGYAIFWGAFFRAEINFGVSLLVKSQVVINFGCHFGKYLFMVLILINFNLVG